MQTTKSLIQSLSHASKAARIARPVFASPTRTFTSTIIRSQDKKDDEVVNEAKEEPKVDPAIVELQNTVEELKVQVGAKDKKIAELQVCTKGSGVNFLGCVFKDGGRSGKCTHARQKGNGRSKVVCHAKVCQGPIGHCRRLGNGYWCCKYHNL
jgi:hypothetical protein